ncbi:MAG: histidine kinase [Bacteroidales bacterium]|nr:histidine kinase [Bacteroidales bacterium]
MMPLFETQVKSEFMKLERGVKFIAIPILTILTVVLLTPWSFDIKGSHIAIHALLSFLGVAGGWLLISLIIHLFRKWFLNVRFWFRLTLQLIVSTLMTILITRVLYSLGSLWFIHYADFCKDFDIVEEAKDLYITTVLFALLINIIYESFYLYLKLSEKAIETERYKKESIEAQYQNLTSRLNPHFLFNSLNTLTTIVEEDPPKAVGYIRELSTVYRYVLNSQKATWVQLDAEMIFAQSYVTLLKMRFEENFRVSIDICEKYHPYHVLAMTVQLLIENAVKHNEISNGNPLEVRIFCSNDRLIVTNKKQKRNILPSTTKVGLLNISERYKFLVNKEVIVEDGEDMFTVRVPLIRNIGDSIVHIDEEQPE